MQERGRGKRGGGLLTPKAWFWPVMLVGTAVDLATKRLAFSLLAEGDYCRIVPHVLGLKRSQNPGALFGMGEGWGTVLAVLSILAVVLLVFLLYRSTARGAWLPVAYGAIAAGAAGNLVDRLFNDGKVRDFIDLHLGRYHWPTFNVADILICIGVGMVIYVEFRKAKKE